MSYFRSILMAALFTVLALNSQTASKKKPSAAKKKSAATKKSTTTKKAPAKTTAARRRKPKGPPPKPMAPPEPIHVDIENKDTALAPFYAALATKGSVVRILHFGDSLRRVLKINFDQFAQKFRTRVRTEFAQAINSLHVDGWIIRHDMMGLVAPTI